MLVLEDNNLVTALRNNYVFRGLSRDVVTGIAALSDRKRFRGGDIIVRQYELGKDLIIVLEGTARIKSAATDTLAEFGPGSMVGEMSLLDDQPRSATIVANGDLEAVIIPADALRQYMAMDSKISSVIMGNLARVLCRRLRSMNDKVESFVPEPKRGGFWPHKRSA
jgi:CRP-like cAMP-binding protein